MYDDLADEPKFMSNTVQCSVAKGTDDILYINEHSFYNIQSNNISFLHTKCVMNPLNS